LQTLISYDISVNVSHRTALLIRCSADEATEIRDRAREDRRTLAQYVLNIVSRALNLEEILAATSRVRLIHGRVERDARSVRGTRTAILVRCSSDERNRIRRAAERNEVTISGFVIYCLKLSWRAEALGRPRQSPKN
jgi:uncharacterized protein (DUF1778 family)